MPLDSEPPLALLSLEGINTFHHPFFTTSTQLTPEPIPASEVSHLLQKDPPIMGPLSPGDPKAFYVDSLLADGSKNPDFKREPQPPAPEDDGKRESGELYDYFLYTNHFPVLLGDTDPGFSVPSSNPDAEKVLARWPPTVVIHGDDDYDVPFSCSKDMQTALGEDKVQLIVAPGQGHLFDLTLFLEDKNEIVLEAVKLVDEIVAKQK